MEDILKFLKGLKKYIPKIFSSLAFSLFASNKKDKDESEEERKEREKEPSTLLLLGVGGAVMMGVTAKAKASIKETIEDYEIPEPKVDWKDIFGEKASSVSKTESSWKDMFSWRDKPKGAPRGFRQGAEVKPTDVEGYMKFGRKDLSSYTYANPMNIRPRMNKYGTAIDERPQDIWQGETGHYFSKSSGVFVSFSDPYYSYRAAAQLLIAYSNPKKRNLHNIHDWIYTYCPTKDQYAGKQATQAYVDDVVNRINSYGRPIRKYDKNGNYIGEGKIDQYSYINMLDKDTYMSVIKAMAWHESHTDVSFAYLSKVYDAHIKGGRPPLIDTLRGGYDGGNYLATRSTTRFSSNANYQTSENDGTKSNGN